MKLRLVFMLVLLVSVLIFAVQNAAIVEIDFLIWEFRIPRSLLIFLMLLIGIIVGWFSKALSKLP